MNADAFARSLQTQVEAEPKRFAQWALGLPLDADRLALVALLHGLAKAPPPNAAAAPDRVPPTVAELWAVLDRFWSRTADREIAMATLWVIRQRPEEGWPTEAADRVADVLIRHPDPASREFNVTRPAHNGLSESRPDVVMTALNCVRGVAAGTLEELLYSRPTWIPRFRATVDRAAGDPHPSVRAAVVGLTAATLNSDRDDAVAKLLTALDGAPDEVLQTPALDHFLGHALPTHLDGLEDVVHRMSRCNLPDVARRGTAWATEIWLHTTEMEASVGKYASGNRDQRLGVADTLAAEFPVGRADGDLAIATLVSLLGDPEADVAAASGALFRDPRTFGRPSAAQLARTFVDSAPTSVGINDLLIGLKGATVPLGPFVPSLLAGVERIGGVAGDGRPHLPFAGHLAEVVLRAYGQAGEDASLRSLCLDACDGLLRYQIGYDLLRQLDA